MSNTFTVYIDESQKNNPNYKNIKRDTESDTFTQTPSIHGKDRSPLEILRDQMRSSPFHRDFDPTRHQHTNIHKTTHSQHQIDPSEQSLPTLFGLSPKMKPFDDNLRILFDNSLWNECYLRFIDDIEASSQYSKKRTLRPISQKEFITQFSDFKFLDLDVTHTDTELDQWYIEVITRLDTAIHKSRSYPNNISQTIMTCWPSLSQHNTSTNVTARDCIKDKDAKWKKLVLLPGCIPFLHDLYCRVITTDHLSVIKTTFHNITNKLRDHVIDEVKWTELILNENARSYFADLVGCEFDFKQVRANGSKILVAQLKDLTAHIEWLKETIPDAIKITSQRFDTFKPRISFDVSYMEKNRPTRRRYK